MRDLVGTLFGRQKIPKPFRAPRPMALEKDRARLSARAKLEALAILLAGVLAAIAPLSFADEQASDATLRLIAGRNPSSRVLIVHASADSLKDGRCPRALGELLEGGHAAGVLIVPPLDVFCRPNEVAKAGAGPVAALPAKSLRLSKRGTVLGFDESAAGDATLASLGIKAAYWVLPVPPESVPAVSLDDVAAGRTPLSAARDRVIVASFDSPFEPPLAKGGSEMSMGTQVGSMLGGLLEGGARRETPRLANALIAALFVLAIAFARRIGSIRSALVVFGVGSLALLIGQGFAASALDRGLLPVVSILVSALVGTILTLALDISGWTRAVTRTSDLLGREGIFRRVVSEPDSVFWPRLGRLAARLFPADFVLVAELPPGAWHLRFWDDGDVGEHLIAERRRDVRRRPFCNDQGVAAPHVTQDFLKNAGEPTVVVPLLALGEMEGFVFFCGEKAEAAFSKSPERMERLARELALVARRRRVSSLVDADAVPSGSGRLLDAPMPPSERLVQRADNASKELSSFGEVLRSSPVGLLYADALGDVRLVSRELGRWLGQRGVSLPPESPDGAIASGALHLTQVIIALAACTNEEATSSLAELFSSESGVTIKSQAGMTPAFVLTIRALRQKADGFSSIIGFVASAVEQVEEKPSNVRALASAPTLDHLGSFPLSEVVAQGAAAVQRVTGRQVKIEAMRGSCQIIGHRAALERALEAFLVDVVQQAPSSTTPVVSMRETSSSVELSILDIGFGVPEAALQRVLIAPGSAPAGLELLGRLILAVEDSHGSVQIRSEDGWGMTLVVSLLRAKPRMKVSVADTPAPASVDNVVTINRNTAK